MTRPARRFRLSRRGRQLALIAHLVTSLAWLGEDLVLLVLGVAAAADPADRHARYLDIRLLLDTLLLPLGLSAILSGLVLTYGGHWGLLKHRWVGAKFLLSAASVLLAVLALLPRADQAATDSARPGSPADTALLATLWAPGWTLVIAPCVALVLYLLATVLSVVKPGRGRRATG
ncbi:DUF2269 domain-containing protein [Kitasatospora sp. NPDC006697]|uniref:DUF2269 domain-containing protein n=1 Tax=Kitasatospora sp. NPDC006697 TaxID=3364020 RepID=UPI0036BD7472